MKKRKGFVAFSTILLVSAVVGVIILSISLNSISDAQQSLSLNGRDEALNFVESCVQDALLTLNNTNTLPSSVTLPLGTCTVTTNSQSGTNWTFTTVGTINKYTRSVYLDVNRTTSITIIKWIDQ